MYYIQIKVTTCAVRRVPYMWYVQGCGTWRWIDTRKFPSHILRFILSAVVGFWALAVALMFELDAIDSFVSEIGWRPGWFCLWTEMVQGSLAIKNKLFSVVVSWSWELGSWLWSLLLSGKDFTISFLVPSGLPRGIQHKNVYRWTRLRLSIVQVYAHC